MDQFHHEVGPARFGLPGVKHLGDIGVVHHGQGLPLGLEAGDYLPGVHPRLDDLQGHFAADRFPLLGHVDHAHAPLGDLLQELVAADDGAGSFGDGRQCRWWQPGRAAASRKSAALDVVAIRFV